MDDVLSAADLEQIARHGLTERRVRRQLELLRSPPRGADLSRAATLGDGVLRLDEERNDERLDLYEEASTEGRFSKFVPASGAASRMFKSLVAACHGEGSDGDRKDCARFFRHLDRFPFRDELRAALAQRGPGNPRADTEAAILETFLDRDGLGYAERPKGLVAFHRYCAPAEIRTPFEEHLIEAAQHIKDGEGRCRLHFTILEAHHAFFRRFFDGIRPVLEKKLGALFDVTFSFQVPSTDTVAADLDGRPFRDRDGKLVIRPGGHGALIGNLGQRGADLVFIKNIDNVLPDERRAPVLRWKKLLGGHLLLLERRLHGILRRAEKDEAGWAEDARSFLCRELGLEGADLPATGKDLLKLLDRPLRVCGVVPVSGEPGGGPFWVRGKNADESLQIVETSQIDVSHNDQAAILESSTHFNPVDLVCRLRDHRGRAYDLEDFIDREAVFVARKSHDGRPLLTLEHPGLWNGAMAFWNTVFVEVPAETFAPVKTVLDLLRPEHQPGGGRT